MTVGKEPIVSSESIEARELANGLRDSAKAFRENPVYDSEGDGMFLAAQADEADRAADMLDAFATRTDPAQVGDGVLRDALIETRRRFDYASDQYHNTRQWDGEDAPDGTNLAEWVWSPSHQALSTQPASTGPYAEYLREALLGIEIYAQDTLTGPVNPADRGERWYADGVREIRNRARAAIRALQPKSMEKADG